MGIETISESPGHRPGELVRVTEKATRPLPPDDQEINNAAIVSWFGGNRCAQEDAGGGGAVGTGGPHRIPATKLWNDAARDPAFDGVAAATPGERSSDGIDGAVLASGMVRTGGTRAVASESSLGYACSARA